jgi:hypothetical protein
MVSTSSESKETGKERSIKRREYKGKNTQKRYEVPDARNRTIVKM